MDVLRALTSTGHAKFGAAAAPQGAVVPKKTSATGSELFIVDNSDNSEDDWKAARYLRDWCQLSTSIDIATGYFEIGALLALGDEWHKVDGIRILMGDEVSRRTRKAFDEGLARVAGKLDDSIEAEKKKNDFLDGVAAIVAAIRSRKIQCRVYRKDKFHAKAYITHGGLPCLVWKPQVTSRAPVCGDTVTRAGRVVP